MVQDMSNKQSVREGLIQVLSAERFQAKPRAGSNTAVVVMEQTGEALRHYGTLLSGQDVLSIGERLWGKFVCYVVDMAERELHIDQKFLTYDRVASVRVQAEIVYQVVDAERVVLRVEDALKSLNTELLALLEREIVRLQLDEVTAQHLEDYLKRESPRLQGRLGIAVERARIRTEWDERLLAQRAEDVKRRRDRQLEDEQRRRQQSLEMEDVAHIDALIRDLGLEGLPADFRLRLVALPRKEALSQIISMIEQQRSLALGALSRRREQEFELLKQMISDGTLEPMDKVEFGKRLMDRYQNMMAYEDVLGMSPTVYLGKVQKPQIEASQGPAGQLPSPDAAKDEGKPTAGAEDVPPADKL